MKRKAILIDSSKAVAGKDVPGATQDVKNWRNFLQSDVGGLWKEHEIADIDSCPTWNSVLEEINKCCTLAGEKYFLFLTFSGHGAFDESKGEDVISLNHDEVVPIGKIYDAVSAITKNAIIVLDACREKRAYVCPTPVYDFTQDLSYWSSYFDDVSCAQDNENNQSKEFDQTDEEASLENVIDDAYIQDIMQTFDGCLDDSGPVLIQSCSLGEFANEYNSGLFSHFMVQFAEEWAAKCKQMYRVLDICCAFNGAKIMLKKWLDDYNQKEGKNEKQNPSIFPMDLQSRLPFAIKIVKPL